MPAPKRIARMVFVLVPEEPEGRLAVRAAQLACRVAHQMGFMPFSPLLYFLTYLSPGELTMELKALSQKWVRRCDRIWLQFPTVDCEDLDGLAYDLLDDNQRSRADRRPVYLLQQSGDDKIGYVPVALTRDEVREILAVNLTAGLARRCI